MEFLRSMFLTPEAQVGAYPWAATLAGHGFVGMALLAIIGAAVWAAFGLSRLVLGRSPRMRPSTAALIAVVGLYALWEAAQVVIGGGIGDALVDWLAVACGALMAFGAWRQLIIPILFGLAVLVAVLIDGVRGRLRPPSP